MTGKNEDHDVQEKFECMSSTLMVEQYEFKHSASIVSASIVSVYSFFHTDTHLNMSLLLPE